MQGHNQDQTIDGSSIENSAVQQVQAGQNAVSFQNSHDNQVTINNVIWRLFGQGASSSVDWDWAQRLLEKKQLPDIRKRLTDTLGRDRTLMQISLEEQLSWVGRSPLQANRHLQVQGEDQGILDWQQMLIETFGREDVGGKLLILGTPGAGKTTALLSLAEQLICGTIAQPKTVIPVIVELSTWREGQQIEDWLIEQLYDLHGGDRKAKRYEQWLEQQVLLPLIDGLDELGLERQKQCTLKLNEFARHYPQLVVCCRVKEFAQANVKLDNLRGSVCLEPLSDEQIQDYLKRIDRLQFWSTIQSTPVLQALLEPNEEGDPGLLRVPLFLTLIANVYDAQHSFQTKEELLDQYINRQLSLDVRQSDRRKETDRKHWEYKTAVQEPDRRHTQQTLHWIARLLKDNDQVEFLIENLQPRHLENKLFRWQYWVLLFIGNLLISGAITTSILSKIFPIYIPISLSSIIHSILLFGLLGGFILSTESKADGFRLIIYFLVKPYCLIFGKQLPVQYAKHVPILHDIDFSFKFRLKIPSIKELRNEAFNPSLEAALAAVNGIFVPLIPLISGMHLLLGELAYMIGMKRLGFLLEESCIKIYQESRLCIENMDELIYPQHILLFEMSCQYVKIIKLKGGKLSNLFFNIVTLFPVFLTFIIFLTTSLIPDCLTEVVKR